MRSTSFYLNPAESRNRDLWVIPIDNYRQDRSLRLFVIMKKDIVHIMSGEGFGYPSIKTDIGMEMTHISPRSSDYKHGTRCLRLVYPFRQEYVERVECCVNPREVQVELSRAGFFESLEMFDKKIREIRSLRANRHKEKMIREAFAESFAKYLDMEAIGLSAPVERSEI